MAPSLHDELEELKQQGLYRSLRKVSGSQKAYVELDGRKVLLLCSNNYLGLADHPVLKVAAVKATKKYGTSSGASRLISGTMELHEELEKKIAGFKGAEAALVFNSGYAANTGVIPALADRGDVIFSDKLNHASIVDGCLISNAELVRYPHNDMAALRRLLERESKKPGRRLIVTDGVFSMDGDCAKLREIVDLKKEFNAMLMVDDAHGTGVLGEHGRGTAELLGVQQSIDVHMGTLGKALGSFGAYIAASRETIDYLINRARSFIFSTSLPPGVCAASLAAFEFVESGEGKKRREKLAENARVFREALKANGFDTMTSETQIVPVFVGDAGKVMEFTASLLEQGVFAQGIRPPTVPEGTCRLRCSLMATHTQKDIQLAVNAITETGKKLGII